MSKDKKQPAIRLDEYEQEIESALPDSLDELSVTESLEAEVAYSREAAANYLRKDAKINIKVLADELNMSRTPVYERIRRLENEGVIGKYVAIRNKDHVGLMLFSEKEELHLPPKRGRRHVLRLVREMLAHERQGRRNWKR